MRQRYLIGLTVCALIVTVALGALIPTKPAYATACHDYTASDIITQTYGTGFTGELQGTTSIVRAELALATSGSITSISWYWGAYGSQYSEPVAEFSTTNTPDTFPSIGDQFASGYWGSGTVPQNTMHERGVSGLSSDPTSVLWINMFTNAGSGGETHLEVGTITVCTDDIVTPTATFTPTNTPSPTPTLSTPPAVVPVAAGGACVLLGIANSTFTDMSQWQLAAGDTLIPQRNMSGSGLLLPEGSATLPLILDPDGQYKIQATFHAETAEADSFTIKLGTETHTVPVAANTDPQSWTGPVEQYQPNRNTNDYSLVLSKLLHSPDPGLIIDFVCVSLVNTDGSGVVVGASLVNVVCQNCTYRPAGGLDNIIDDIMKLIGWLWCGIQNLWTCVISAMINGIWQTVVNIVTFIAMLRLWVARIIENAVAWGIGNIRVVANWVGGHVTNLLTSIINLAIRLINSLGIGEWINRVVEFILSLPALAVSVAAEAVSIAGITIQILETIVSTVASLILRVWTTIWSILGIIPTLIISLVNGFNSTNTVPVWAPSCSDSAGFFYAPCLSMYVIDNTIFDGPAYYVILVVMGFLSFNTILWTSEQIRDVLEKS